MREADAKQRILLVEESCSSRVATRALLTLAGYAVDAVANGLAAMAAAGAQSYDLILMDLYLAGLDGLESARCIRRLPPPRGDATILIMSPIATDEHRCLAAGMDGFLPKPVTQVRLLATLAHWKAWSQDPAWGLDPRPRIAPPLLSRRIIRQLEEDVGAELLPEILRTFLIETDRRMKRLVGRVDAGDARAVGDEAHTLKGSAGTFGALALCQTAFELEQAGRRGDLGRIGQLVPELNRLAGQTCNLLRDAYPFLAP